MSLPLVLNGEAAVVRFAGEKEADTGLVYLLSEGTMESYCPSLALCKGSCWLTHQT